MKTIKKTYRVETRANPRQPWQTTYYNLESKKRVRQYIGNLVKTLQWRILEHREVVEVVATRPWKSCLKQRRQMCQQWPHCGCAMRGTKKDCESRR